MHKGLVHLKAPCQRRQHATKTSPDVGAGAKTKNYRVRRGNFRVEQKMRII